MESPSSQVFQSRLCKKLSGSRVPAVCLRLRMMLKKIANSLYDVSTERQGKENTSSFAKKKKKRKHSVNSAIVTPKRGIQFPALSF